MRGPCLFLARFGNFLAPPGTRARPCGRGEATPWVWPRAWPASGLPWCGRDLPRAGGLGNAEILAEMGL